MMPLHLVVGKRDGGHRALGRGVGGDALDGERDDLLRLALGISPRRLANLAQRVGGVGVGLLLEPANQLRLRVLGGHAGHLLEAAALLAQQTFQLLLSRLHHLLAAPKVAGATADVAVALLDGIGAALQGALALADPTLLRLDAASPVAELLLCRLSQLDQLFLAGKHGGLAERLGLTLGVLDGALGYFVGGRLGGALALELRELTRRHSRPTPQKENCRQGDDECAERGNECHLVHIGSMLHRASAGEGKPPLCPRSADRQATLEDAPTWGATWSELTAKGASTYG